MAHVPRTGGRRTGGARVLTILGALVGLLIVGTAVTDAATSGTGNDARARLNLIAPAGAGGGWDSAAREMQAAMRAQGVVNNPQVVNIPGAGGTIGLNQLSEMDGEASTMMITGITMLGAIAINGSETNLGDVTPIARLADDYDVVVVPANSPIQTMDDLTAAWKEDPSTFAFGGGSLGSVDQMIISQLARESGIDPNDVNYIAYSGGAELATSLLSGTIKASVSGNTDFAPQVESGSLRALAVSAPEPVESIDLPTLVELGYDVSLTNWRGIVAPPGISEEQKSELETIVSEAVETPEWKSAIERNQWTDTFLVGEEFSRSLAAETEFVNGIWAELGY